MNSLQMYAKSSAKNNGVLIYQPKFCTFPKFYPPQKLCKLSESKFSFYFFFYSLRKILAKNSNLLAFVFKITEKYVYVGREGGDDRTGIFPLAYAAMVQFKNLTITVET